LSSVAASIINPNVVEQHDTGDLGKAWLAKNTAGSGPFIVSEWVQNSHFTLVRNPNYWGDRVPQVDRIIVQVIPEASQQAIMLERGDVDIAYDLQPVQIADLQAKGFQVASGPDLSTYYLAM